MSSETHRNTILDREFKRVGDRNSIRPTRSNYRADLSMTYSPVPLIDGLLIADTQEHLLSLGIKIARKEIGDCMDNKHYQVKSLQ